MRTNSTPMGTFASILPTLNFSVEDGAAVFVTFDMYDDPPEFLSAVERVFAGAGWSTGEVG